jgi:hypothetical protein
VLLGCVVGFDYSALRAGLSVRCECARVCCVARAGVFNRFPYHPSHKSLGRPLGMAKGPVDQFPRLSCTSKSIPLKRNNGVSEDLSSFKSFYSCNNLYV